MKNPEMQNYHQKDYKQKIDNIRMDLTFETWKESLNELIETLNTPKIDEKDIPLLQSKIAFILENIIELWLKEGKEIAELKEEMDKFFNSKSDLPIIFKHTRNTDLDKRQPDLLESIKATMDRFEMMTEIEKVFEKKCKSMIVGGSISYGPFYNVRAERDGKESSDIDAIFILDEQTENIDWNDFLNCPFFSEEEKIQFIKRLQIFLKTLCPTNKADILSQKFHIQNSDYAISIHFLTEKGLDLITNPDMNADDGVKIIKDYKFKPFVHKESLQKNFEGQSFVFPISEQKKVEGGLVTELPAYIIKDGKYYPGIYQNVILPSFFIFYDKDGSTTEKIYNFKEKIKDHIKTEYGEDNVEERIISSHTRNTIFPPTLKDEI